MHIVELTYPGTCLDHADRDWCWKIEGQVRSLESTLIDAALALSLFDAERATPRGRRHSRETWDRDSRRRQEIEDAIRARLGVERYAMDRYEEVRSLAELEFKREQWSAGRMPSSYEHRLVFVYARSFVNALDRLERCLAVLAKEDGVPVQVAESHAGLCAALPHLREVRNSVSHFEDRSRGLGRGGRPLTLQPVMNQMVNAPGGGVLMLESLNNNCFGTTMADGHYGEVEVSVATLATAANCVQQVINAFTWKGWPRHVPD